MFGRRIAACITLMCLFGCYSMQAIPREQLAENSKYPIYAVITEDEQHLEFDPNAVMEDSVISGQLKNGPTVSIALSQVSMAYVRKPDDFKNIAACYGIGSIVGMVVFAVLLKEISDPTY